MPRVTALSVGISVGIAVGFALGTTLGLAACGGETKTAGGPAPPPGIGYGDGGVDPADLRTLSRDDCIALRDHQIEIAVASALGEAGSDPGARLTIESEVRARMKAETDAWLKRCAGHVVAAKDWRCMKDATTTAAFLSCGEARPDAGVDG